MPYEAEQLHFSRGASVSKHSTVCWFFWILLLTGRSILSDSCIEAAAECQYRMPLDSLLSTKPPSPVQALRHGIRCLECHFCSEEMMTFAIQAHYVTNHCASLSACAKGRLIVSSLADLTFVFPWSFDWGQLRGLISRGRWQSQSPGPWLQPTHPAPD